MANSAQLAEAQALYQQLAKEIALPNADLKKCGSLLAKLKIALTQLSFLVPAEAAPDPASLALARDVLEIGAQYSIRVKDIPAFERYVSQLKTYHNDYTNILPPSSRMYPIIGLNLLRLLAQNRISDFHTELETIDPEQLQSNIYIQHPVEVEQCLMEGSYNKVWNSRQNVPTEDYLLFMDILMDTIRSEIADCSEKAYTSLPLSDAATLLHFKTNDEVLAFAKERDWKVDPATKKIHFATADSSLTDIPRDKIVSMMISYAKELERIV
ncbi:COP9 signalosome [Hyaloraphidium curvatum]|nr:COP9 signalosome [Hyaloraphidium curvatum]